MFCLKSKTGEDNGRDTGSKGKSSQFATGDTDNQGKGGLSTIRTKGN